MMPQRICNTGALGLSNPEVFPVRHRLMIVVSALHGWNMSLNGRKSLVVVDWCDLKSISECVFSEVKPLLIQLTLVTPVGSFIANSIPELLNIDSWYCRRGGKCSEEVGLLQNVHRNLCEWVVPQQTATASTLADGTLELRATIDTLEYTITEASVRSKLQLADASRISMLPNTEIFEGMGNMGFYFSKLIFDGLVANLKSKTKFLMYPRFLQMILEIQTENKHPYLAVALTKKIFGNMKRGFRRVPRPLLSAMLPVVDQSAGPTDQAEDQPSSSKPLPSTSHPTPVAEPTPVLEPTTHPTSPSLEPDNEPTEHTFDQPSTEHQPLLPRSLTAEDLLHMVPTLIRKVNSLETELKQTKQTMGKAIVKLVKKVKKLENILKRRNVVLTTSEDEEPEDQGRIFKDIDDDPLVSFVTPTKPSGEAQEEEISPTTLEVVTTLSKVASQRLKSVDKGKRYKRRKEFKGKDFEDISTGFKEVNTGGLGFSTGSGPVSSDRGQREGKAQMIFEAQHYTEEDWDAIRAKLEANAELAKSVIAKDMSEEDFAKRMVDLVNQRKKYFAEERVKSKNESNFKEIKEEFDKLIKQVDTFVPMSLKATKAELKIFGEELQCKILKASYKIIKQGKKGVYQIVRENGTDKVYMSLGAMLKEISREDLTELYRIVMKRYGTEGPTDDYERVFWENLKTMFDAPLSTDLVWSLPANVCQTVLKMKLLDGKMNEDCYKLLKMMEKRVGVKK
ncbi:hypothetical protein Tco_1285138 [Tanacetum coccineum]